MMFMRFFFSVVFCLSLAACSTSRNIPNTSAPANPTFKIGNPYKVSGKIYRPQADPNYDKVGLASWYGQKFHGLRTANGDIFNMNDLTAAHTTLPMPSYVRVTNIENGRWLILKVNDRGPFVGDRLIDVSRRAAQLLGFEKKGVTHVRVQAVKGPRGELPEQITASISPTQKIISPSVVVTEQISTKTEPADNRDKKIYIQIGAYADQKNAKKVVDAVQHITTTELAEVDVNGQNLYRVRVGPQSSLELAEIILGKLLSLGHNTARIIMDY